MNCFARKQQAALIPLPSPKPEPDFAALTAMIVEGVKRCISDGYQDEDFQHYVYEAAIEAVYGKEYWEWRRAQRW